jgi:hypothetical protein
MRKKGICFSVCNRIYTQLGGAGFPAAEARRCSAECDCLSRQGQYHAVGVRMTCRPACKLPSFGGAGGGVEGRGAPKNQPSTFPYFHRQYRSGKVPNAMSERPSMASRGRWKMVMTTKAAQNRTNKAGTTG